ncbi:MAG: hypothetical protein WBL67_02685 [Nitrososphaeraceae archaeon]
MAVESAAAAALKIIIGQIFEAFNRYKAEHKREQELKAGEVIKASNILRHSLKALDNEFRRILGSVEEVKPATTSEKRESIKSEVRAFASVHEIISEVKASVRELESNVKFNYIDPENCKELVRHLAGIGRDTITYAEGENKVMVISGYTMLPYESLCQKIDNVTTENDAQNLKERCKEMERNFHSGAISVAQDLYGDIKTCIGNRYPGAFDIANV